MSKKPNLPEQVISLPKGGGALSGIGEKFSPDLFTGTGNYTVPIALPPGRNSFQPEITLVYSTGTGNGSFGLGWSLNIPGIRRKTSDGVPRYNEASINLRIGERRDEFVLSGAEDLVQVSGRYPGMVQYRPRTEGLFARIERHLYADNDYWQIKTKDGLISTYGKPHKAALIPPVIRKPDSSETFAWTLTETKDAYGNIIRYGYDSDAGAEVGHRWNQPLLSTISYVDYGDPSDDKFLVQVQFNYESRPDPFSDYRAGFEIRCTKRCASITVSTHTVDGVTHIVRRYDFHYRSDPNTDVSLLQQIEVIGYDDDGNPYQDDPAGSYPKQLRPLTFGYTQFAPQQRKFEVLSGRDLPARALGAPDMEFVDLHGSGLPDIVEMTSVMARYWRNFGRGRFDLPRRPPALPSPPWPRARAATGRFRRWSPHA